MSDMGLSIVDSALHADQAEMATVADNLANVSTPGYARESVDVSTFPGGGPNGVGAGVQLLGVDQLHSELLDAAARSAAAGQAAANTTQGALQSVENLFPEPSSNGLGSQLDQLWTDLSTLSSDPSNGSAGAVVLNDLGSVTSVLRNDYAALSQAATGLTAQLTGGGAGSGGLVFQANQDLAEVSQLNQRIVAGRATGTDVNALIDQRRTDLTSLAQMLGVAARPEQNGSVTVFAQGVALVQGDQAVSVSITGSPSTGTLAVATSSGVTLPPGAVGGQAAAILTAVNRTIPGYQQSLSAVANSLAEGLNSLQASGFDAAGTPGSSLPPILVSGGSSTFAASGSSAADIQVNPALAASQLATAGAGATTAGTPTLDGTNAAAMAALGAQTGGAADLYRQLVGTVGSDVAAANGAAQSAQALADQTSASAASVSGVNTNSEAMNMIQAQQAFQAASKVASSIVTSLDALLQAV